MYTWTLPLFALLAFDWVIKVVPWGRFMTCDADIAVINLEWSNYFSIFPHKLHLFRLCSFLPRAPKIPSDRSCSGIWFMHLSLLDVFDIKASLSLNIICLNECSHVSDVLLHNTHVSMWIRSRDHVSSCMLMMTDSMTLIDPEMLRAYMGS